MGRRKPNITTKVIELPSSDENTEEIMMEDQGSHQIAESSTSTEGGKKGAASEIITEGHSRMLIEIPRCTACAIRLLPEKRKHMYLHPVLEVLLCKECYNFYTSGDFDKDSEGYDEQCRWCGEGGLLLGCDYCTNAFCKPCIKRNIGRSALYNLVNAPESTKWRCYVCQPAPLKKLRKECLRALEGGNRENEQRKREWDWRPDANYHLSDIQESADKFYKIQTAILQDLKSLNSKIDDCRKRANELSSHQFKIRKEKLADKLKNLISLVKNGASMVKLSEKSIPDPLRKRESATEVKRLVKVRSSFDRNPELKEDITVIEREGDVVDVHKVPSTLNQASDNGEGNLEDAQSVDHCDYKRTIKVDQAGMNIVSEEKNIDRHVSDPEHNDTKYLTGNKEDFPPEENIVRALAVNSGDEDGIESHSNVDDSEWHENSKPSFMRLIRCNSDDGSTFNSRVYSTKLNMSTEPQDCALKRSNDIIAIQEVSSIESGGKHLGNDEKCADRPIEFSVGDQGKITGEISPVHKNDYCKSKYSEKGCGGSRMTNKADLQEKDELKKDNDRALDKLKDMMNTIYDHDPDINLQQSGKHTTNSACTREIILENDKAKEELENMMFNCEGEIDSENRHRNGKSGIKLDNKAPNEDDRRKNGWEKVSILCVAKTYPDPVSEQKANPEVNEIEMNSKHKSRVKLMSSSGSDGGSSYADDDEPRRKKSKKKSKKCPLKSAGNVAESSDSSDYEKFVQTDVLKTVQKFSSEEHSKRFARNNIHSDVSNKKEERQTRSSQSHLDEEIKKLTTSDISLLGKKNTGNLSNPSAIHDEINRRTKNGRHDDVVMDGKSDNSYTDEEESNTAKLLRDLAGESLKSLTCAKEVVSSYDEESAVEDLSNNSDAVTHISKRKSKTKEVSESERSGSSRSKDRRKQYRAELLRERLSETDSDNVTKKSSGKSKRNDPSASDLSEVGHSDASERIRRKRHRKSSHSESAPLKRKRRRRIKTLSDSSVASDEEDRPTTKRKKKKSHTESEEHDDVPTSAHKRKHIRKIISDKKLEADTKAAAQEETDRRERVEERQKRYNEILCLSEIVEAVKVPVTPKLILEVDEDSKELLIEVDRDLIRNLKPHQVEAVKFMWNCTIESLEQMKTSEGSGCILAHCMGLGKTLSVITLVHTILQHKKLLNLVTCLVVCPLNTVLNWENEWAKWFENTPDVQLNVFVMSHYKTKHQRLACLKDWQHEGGVCIIGYEMFRNLSKGNHMRAKKMKASFVECLLDPGPDIVVCDEGHILKNCESGLSKIMSEIRTKRRIILTGTPLQNNLNEYHCMVSFVKPKLLGTKKEFYNRIIAPITNGSCADSTTRDVRIMKKRAHVLHEMLNGCVQRRDYSALTPYLPPKFEYVLSVRLSKHQINLYQKYMDRREEGSSTLGTTGTRLFQDFQVLMRIWTHPWSLKLHHLRILAQRAKQELDESDDFLNDDLSESDSTKDSSTSSSDDEVKSASESESDKAGASKQSVRRRGRHDFGNDDEIVSKWKTTTRRGVEDAKNECPKEDATDDNNEWWFGLVNDEDEENLNISGKLIILFQILKKAEEIGDKVLVFSQSLLALDMIEKFLEAIDIEPGTLSSLNDGNGETYKSGRITKPLGCTWVKGADYFRLDGSTNVFNRQKYCDVFNDYENSRARLFLISTRAGSLGINLVHANRVVIFDASWNPTYDVQSMFRVYRFGQLKPVYVYRLVAQGTMEEKIYERQVAKQSLSQRVVDEHQIDRHFSSQDLQELYRFEPDRLDDAGRRDRPTPALPKDLLLADLLKEQAEWIVCYHEHDSLLENKVDQELTEEERKAAWEEYEAEKKGLITNASPYIGSLGGISATEWLTHYAQRDSALLNYNSPLMPQMLMPPDSFLQEVSRQLLRQNPHMSPAEVMHRARSYWIRNLQVQELQKQQLLAGQQQELIRLHQKRQQQRLVEHQRLQKEETTHCNPQTVNKRSSDESTVRSLLTNTDCIPDTHVIADD